jgi:hypothetical protein
MTRSSLSVRHLSSATAERPARQLAGIQARIGPVIKAEGRIRGYGKLVIAGIVEIGRELVRVKARVGYKGYAESLTIDASSLYLIAAPS